MSGIYFSQERPFERLNFHMTEEELDLPITFIAVHATPRLGRPAGRKRVLKWRLVCLHYPLDVRRKMRAVSFEVDPMVHLVPGIEFSCVFLRDESFIHWENSIDFTNYWWHKDALKTSCGATPSFRDIIHVLEKADDCWDIFVNPNTFEGSYYCVCRMIELLEERHYLTGTSYDTSGEQPGTGQVSGTMALDEFRKESKTWVQAMEVYDCV